MATYPERAFYNFNYHDGWPVSFAQIEVWAQAASGRVILVAGGNNRLRTDGNGLLQRITPQPSWSNPEVRLIDTAAGRRATFPLFAWDYKVDWDRPAPFAEFDGQEFGDPGDFLNYLDLRYSYLSNMQPSPLNFTLTRVGSPAEFPQSSVLFLQLKDEMAKAQHVNQVLDPNDPPDLVERVEELRTQPARYVLWALSDVIPVNARTFGKHTNASLAEAFGQILKRIATAKDTLSLPKILAALKRALKWRNGEVLSEPEDWAQVGLLVFLAGLLPFGYEFASLDDPDDPNLVLTSVTMRLARP